MNLDRLISLDAGQRIDFTESRHYEFESPMSNENGVAIVYPLKETQQHMLHAATYASMLVAQTTHEIQKVNGEIAKRFNHLSKDLIPKRRYEVEIHQVMQFLSAPRRTAFNFTVRVTRLN